MSYQTLVTRFEESICFIQIDRPRYNNTINDTLIAEFNDVLSECDKSSSIVVITGTPEVFCFGADFNAIARSGAEESKQADQATLLYDLWLKLATGPYVTISYVRGKANAGGLGFIAASDVVLADDTATFGLSELLFGVYPAMVLPFLVRRIGFQRAHYLTLMTQPITARQAYEWGLIDALGGAAGDAVLRRHLLRLRRLSRPAIQKYKAYMSTFNESLFSSRSSAIAANVANFDNARTRESIRRFVEHGLFPWEDP